MRLGLFIRHFFIKHFRYIIAGVAVLLLLFGYMALIGPEIKSVRQFGVVDLKSEQKQLTERNNYLSRLQGMIQSYSEISSAQINDLEQILPSKPDIADLFIIIEGMAKAADLSLLAVAISPTASPSSASAASSSTGEGAPTSSPAQAVIPASQLDSSIKAFDLSVSVSGGSNYEDFKKFLTTIEDTLRYFNVLSLTFSQPVKQSTAVGSEAKSNNYVVNLRTYYLDLEETP